MKCPNCGLVDNKGRVLDSRHINNTIKRRRECSHCNGRWTTFEVVEEEYFTQRNKHSYKGWTEGELATLVRLYQSGLSKTAIGEKLGNAT